MAIAYSFFGPGRVFAFWFPLIGKTLQDDALWVLGELS